MRVAAVVVNHNGASDLVACVEALRAQTVAPVQVLVVDNASVDGSVRVLEELASEPGPVPVRVLPQDENRGYAGGANVGIAMAGAVDAVLVANPDARPRPDYLQQALAALADPTVGSVQGRLLRTAPSPAGAPVIDTTGHVAFTTRLFQNRGEGEIDRGQWATAGEVFGVSGALALYRRRMLDDVAIDVHGGTGTRREVFDEDLFAFWEDVDLDWRAAMRGWACRYEPSAVAVHERGGAGPRRTEVVEQLNFQNRLLVLVKNDTWRGLLPALPGLVLTTMLKAAELVLTSPRAFVQVVRSLPKVARMRGKRTAVHGRAVVPSARVVDRWFEPFDYGRWIATWWHRVRGRPPGHEPRS